MKRELKNGARGFSSSYRRLRPPGQFILAWIRGTLVAITRGRLVLFSLLAYLLGRAPLVPEVHPFALALFTVVLKRNGPLAGLLILLCGSHGMAAKLSAGVAQYWLLVGTVTAWVVSWPLGRRVRLGYNSLLVIIAIILLIPLLLVAPWLVPELILWLPTLAGIWALSNLFMPLLDLAHRRTGTSLTYSELAAISLILLGVLLGLTGTYVGGIHLQELVGIILFMMGAHIGGLAVGIIGGMLVGLLVSLTSGNLLLVGIYGMFGLLAGLGATYRKLGICFALVIANLLLPFFVREPVELFTRWTLSAVGVIGFALIPTRLLRRLARSIPHTEEQRLSQEMTNKRLREMLNQRLDDFARVFDELSATFNQIPRRSEQSDHGYDDFLMSLTRKACGDCPGFRTCWESRFHQTYWDMVELLAIAEKNTRIQFADLPEAVVKYCMQPYQLTTSINAVTEMLRLESFWQRRLQESQEVVTNQLEGLSHIMRSFASQMELEVVFDEEWEQRLKAVLTRHKVPLDSLRVVGTPGGKPEIHVRMEHCGGIEACRDKVATAASRALGQKYSVWTRECTDILPRARCEFVLLPERVYNVQIEAVKVARDGSLVSGDTHSQVWLKDGKLAIVLSDGMGYGPRAALESTATIAMLKQLMKAGFDREFAVRTVNSILLLRSSDEIFATVDLVIADLYTGELEFIKIGASPSFLIRTSGIDVIRSNTLPIGILNHVEMEPEIRIWRHGDILLMMTDGILNGYSGLNEEWLNRIVRRTPQRDLKTITNLIIEDARAAMGGEIKDDMTVVAVLLRRRTSSTDIVEESGINEIPVYDRRLA